MKLRKKIILVLAIISMLSIFLLISKNDILYNKVEENNIGNEIENGIAVYVANDTDYERVDSIPESGYVYNSEKSYCNENEVRNDNIKISYDIDTKKISISPIANEKTKCYLYFDVKTTKTVQVGNLTLEVNLDTPDFSKTSCSSGCGETTVGIYEAEDGMYGGISYYWRGDTEDNYVMFGGYCWRIIRINGDGSIRLIYDGSSCHANGTSTTDSIAVTSQTYNSNYNSSVYVGWSYTTGQQHGTATASNARVQVESWYNTNLTNYASYISDGKYCNDRNVANGYTWTAVSSSTFYYATRERLETNKAPTLSCTTTSDVFTLKVGLIIADEVSFAGGAFWIENTSYYLYNGNYYWTMSPYHWDSSYSYASMFRVYPSGYCDHDGVGDDGVLPGLRPVINLKADVTFSSGSGTQTDPYVVKTT